MFRIRFSYYLARSKRLNHCFTFNKACVIMNKTDHVVTKLLTREMAGAIVTMLKTTMNKDVDLEITNDVSMIMKGFAILFVVITHFPFEIPYFSLRGLGGWGVSTFLFVSGFGLEKSYQAHDNKGFWKKRLIHTYCPFVLAMIIQLIIRLSINDVRFRLLTIPSLLGLSPNNRIDGSMWFIPYIFLWYTVFFLSTFFKKSIIIRVIILLQFSIIIFCISLLPVFNSGAANLYIVVFISGVLFANVNLKSYCIKKWMLFCFSAIFLISWYVIRNYDKANISAYLFYSIAPFFVLCLSKLVFLTKIRRLFISIGKYSYHVYLFEYLCITLAFSSIPNYIYTKYNFEKTSIAVSISIFILLVALFTVGSNLLNKTLFHRRTS